MNIRTIKINHYPERFDKKRTAPVYNCFELFIISVIGNKNVTLKIIEGKYGHDTFLLDVNGMGTHTQVRCFLLKHVDFHRMQVK